MLVTKLDDKLEQYKFGLPTLLISGEQEIYQQTKEETEKVNTFYTLKMTHDYKYYYLCVVMLENKNTIRVIISETGWRGVEI